MSKNPKRTDTRTKSELVDRDLRFIAQRYELGFYLFMCEPTLGQPVIRRNHGLSTWRAFSLWLIAMLKKDPELLKLMVRVVDNARREQEAPRREKRL